jgi:hypothetical protein
MPDDQPPDGAANAPQPNKGFRFRARPFIQAIVARDRAVHAQVMQRFPRAVPVVDSVFSGIFAIFSQNPFGLIVGLLVGIVLVVTGKIDKIVGISIIIAWAVALVWIARSSTIKSLTILSRIAVTLLIAALLASLGIGFGSWALRGYHQQQIANVSASPSPTPNIDLRPGPSVPSPSPIVSVSTSPSTPQLKPMPRENSTLTPHVQESPAGSTKLPLEQLEPPSVAFLYENKQIRIHNLTKTEFYLWGDKLGDGPVRIEPEPRVVSPQPFFYFIEGFEELALAQTPEGGETRTVFYPFVEDKHKQKFTLKCLLWATVKDHQLNVRTQNLGVVKGWLK